MKSVIKSISSLGLAVGLCSAAFAVPFTGQIGFNTIPGQGSTLNFSGGTTLGFATGAQANSASQVTLVEGSFPVSLLADVVTYKAFNFVVGAQPIAELWKVTDTGPGVIYTFDLTAITSYTNNGNNLSISGVGLLKSSNPALDPTGGNWTYQITTSDGTSTSGLWQFQSNNGAAAPDGGSMAVLLGSALLGMVWVSRRLKSVA